MRLIKEKFLRDAAPAKSKAGKWLDAWIAVVRAASWKNLQDLRRTYPYADALQVSSGRSVTVFNVCGNDCRLIVAIHYDKQRLYTLRFLTHAEYSKDHWKKEL